MNDRFNRTVLLYHDNYDPMNYFCFILAAFIYPVLLYILHIKLSDFVSLLGLGVRNIHPSRSLSIPLFLYLPFSFYIAIQSPSHRFA